MIPVLLSHAKMIHRKERKKERSMLWQNWSLSLGTRLHPYASNAPTYNFWHLRIWNTKWLCLWLKNSNQMRQIPIRASGQNCLQVGRQWDKLISWHFIRVQVNFNSMVNLYMSVETIVRFESLDRIYEGMTHMTFNVTYKKDYRDTKTV